MAMLLERLRGALAPEFDVNSELGAGGMGVVYAAWDRRLDRPVAIKVLRPEAATAVASERFLREARLQARLRHPNVVTVHRAGEADGLLYFAMELIEGPTLSTRLTRGPLTAAEASALATDVLAALAAAHRQGIVHRDVKPSNIFLVEGRALLADFGIARGETSGQDDTLTLPGSAPGTPAYMAPEQLTGQPTTWATDIYAAGLVLFEALTGRSWRVMSDPATGDWHGVPRHLVSALQRALAVSPEDRWSSADAFAMAIHRGQHRRILRPIVAGAALSLVAVAAYLAGPDRGRAGSEFGSAAPQTREGRLRLDEAETYYRGAQWKEADRAYRRAIEADSTCLVCAFRLNDVDNWLQRPQDPLRITLLTDRSDRFPLEYRRLLEADRTDHPARMDLLRDVTERWPEFALGWYMYGEDLYNRGALFGRMREEAIRALRRAVTLDPTFAPPWFDLALAQIADGDSVGAAEAIAFLGRLHPTGDLAQAQRTVANVAWGFRFGGDGLGRFRESMQDPRIAAMPDAAAGPRVMPGLGTPLGAVELGREYESWTGDEARPFRRSGLIAQIFGHASLGQLQAMRDAGRRLVRDFATQTTQSLPARLDAALHLWDDGLGPEHGDRLRAALEPFLRPGVQADVRNGAAWMGAVLAYRVGDTVLAHRLAAMVRQDGAPGPATILLQGWEQAARGRFEEALVRTDLLARSLAAFSDERDPFVRAGVRLSRALWLEQAGSIVAARDEYRWHQHFHLSAYPKEDPIVAEADWALGTLASWRQARLLDGREESREVCVAYRTVAERWSDGEPPYRERAQAARERLAALQCGATR